MSRTLAEVFAAEPPEGGAAVSRPKAVRPCISLPAPLVALYRDNAARLPPLSEACAAGVRAALEGLGDVDVPPAPAPTRTAAATAASARKTAAAWSAKGRPPLIVEVPSLLSRLRASGSIKDPCGADMRGPSPHSSWCPAVNPSPVAIEATTERVCVAVGEHRWWYLFDGRGLSLVSIDNVDVRQVEVTRSERRRVGRIARRAWERACASP